MTNNVWAMNRDELIDAYIEHLSEEERKELLVQLVTETEDTGDLLFCMIQESPLACYDPEWLRANVEDMDREAEEAGKVRK